MDVFNAALQDTVESILNKSRKLTVLDRTFLKDQMTELNTIASGNSPISELARLGNTVGADLMVVSEIISFSQTLDKTKLGNQTIERTEFNAEISIKVINVATSNILFSQRFPFKRQRIKASNPASSFGKRVGSRLARRVAGKLGGGGQGGFSGSAGVDAAVKRTDKSFDDAKKGVKDDW
jgi:curli biogenesis system outer membrane secretion channel CsgG